MNQVKTQPFVSIVIPVRNEENSIEACVKQIFRQTYPMDRLEVLVIDGMSTDGTKQKVGTLISENPSLRNSVPVIKILDNPRLQRAPGLNIGIRHAKGDVILRLDARTKIDSDYVNLCVATLNSTGAQNVGGLQLPIGETPTQQGIALAMSHPFGVGNAQFRLGKKSGFVDTVYLGCYPKDIFEKVGLFDEDSSIISEESDMNQRIQKAGGKIYLNPGIKAYYSTRDTLKSLWDLYFRYGGARAGNLLKHKRLTSWRQSVPPAMLAALVISGLLSIPFVYPRYVFIAILSLYLLASAASSASLTLKARKPKLTPIVFSAFFCMHFGWSAGFYRRLMSRDKPGAYWGN